ncbi:class I SAM-dependent methyltransferase [Bradyrhizobium sp. 186]|uniref:class I SAM-dependent methyltransferase n=1 Tax=Bradyrhizobium sp. 186 TaxID=2782654 RepID=UPI002001725E|nr:class I SAM-dependent methyltransferase [Bradyrhizobium sp. 186]UPK33962.1 class I SAM-dependent methyltransferase [Bradyrhizobium sp. 186]
MLEKLPNAAETPSLEASLEKATDQAFKARATFEYQQVRKWVGSRVNLDEARILDFGCGQGVPAASFALRHPKARVLGVDIEPVPEQQLSNLLNKQIGCGIPSNVSYRTLSLTALSDEKFDLIYAWSVFEHVKEDKMIKIFSTLKSHLAERGILFVCCNPLYFSPHGSHLYKYFKSPWHHLLLTLDELREGVVSGDLLASETREWQQFLQLNRLTAQDIMGRASGAGLKRLRHHLTKTDLSPPPRLARLYDNEVLTTKELVAIFE